MIKRYSFIFGIAFFLNLMWENVHAFLYLHYQGGPITEQILLRATLFDAVFIILLLILIDRMKVERSTGVYIQIGVSFLVAVLIEVFALGASRWAYGPWMPIIPILEVGLSPIIQLPLLGYLSGRITTHLLRK
ncbi:MAG: hypothetical protein AAB903_01165 [Patescibacteria group bacterium]